MHMLAELGLTDIPGQCTPQVNARLSTPKIHLNDIFKLLYLDNNKLVCLEV
jgi:hypothetical protein